MSRLWRIILIVSVSILLVAVGYWGYQYYQKIKNPVSPVLSAISPNTFLFAEIINATETFDKLTDKTELWKEIIGIPALKQIHNEVLYFDSVLKTDSYINEIYNQQKFVIALNQTNEGKPEAVYIFELPAAEQGRGIDHFVKKINGEKSIVMQKSYQNADIMMVNISKLEKIFCYTVYNGLFIGSFEEHVLNDVIDHIRSGKPVNSNERFRRIEQTAGKNVDANIYINYAVIDDFAKNLLDPDFAPTAETLNEFAEWTETDLTIMSDELLLNGYSIIHDTGHSILKQFCQEPQEIKVQEILPYDVSLLLHLGFENFEQHFLIRSKMVDFKEQFSKFESSFRKKYRIDVQQEFISWIGNELAFAEKYSPGSNHKASFVVIHSSDVKTAEKSLTGMVQKIDRALGVTSFNRESGEYLIRKINDAEMLENIFGELFSSIDNNYYVILKDYVIFANRPTDLIGLINNFYNQKTLAENFNYQNFCNNISDKSNIYFYCNLRNSLSEISKFFNPEIEGALMKNEKQIRNFEGLALQFSYVNQMFYTNIYLKYNPSYQEVNPSNWAVELEAEVTAGPYFIRNHKTKKLNVVAFDKLQNMYLIDHIGQIQWKVPLLEEPKSPVYEIDYYKNGKIQYLFNTENYFYLVDLNGNFVADFPVKLVTHATNPMAVIDYENNRNYRLLLALSDNKIYNFDLKGKMVDGWKKVKTKVAVTQPVQHVVQGGKDYIFITDENQNVTITNRRGEERIKIRNKLKKAKNAQVYVNRTNSKGIFITTDDTGKLNYISSKGKTSTTDFGDFTKDHYFLYDDFTGNNIKDFIYVDGNTLTVFDRFKKVILGHSFEYNINSQPILFEGNDNMLYLAIMNAENNEILIFDKNGLVHVEQNLYGLKSVIAGSLNKNEKISIVVGMENKIVNYQLD